MVARALSTAPGTRNHLADVSNTAAEYRGDVSGLRSFNEQADDPPMARVEPRHHLTQVDQQVDVCARRCGTLHKRGLGITTGEAAQPTAVAEPSDDYREPRHRIRWPRLRLGKPQHGLLRNVIGVGRDPTPLSRNPVRNLENFIELDTILAGHECPGSEHKAGEVRRPILI